ncbi:MAG: 2-oxoacid:acceptor oxidoreductase subunit alpha [Candidatus Margulisbacteria bacterium]|nr:2-oxoacid:acceptor oxidoreductase subunit alpha [Candidatus Margulisiibacteriota bacterium]
MKNDVSIVLCGEAGQGLKTVESVLTAILKQDGYNVFATKEYMSRVRGGVNTTSIRVSSGPVMAYVDKIDLLLSLNPSRTKHLESRTTKETVVIEEQNNMVATGLVCGLFDVELSILNEQVKRHFSAKAEKVVHENLEAAEKGHRKGRELVSSKRIDVDVKKDDKVKGQLLLNGADAVGLGAIAGGCNFISAYPMSPSTGVLVFLSQHARRFGIVTEQAEDEISAMNMALGAWYAGGRALVSTSGGGFALMTEGLSLAGMLELPVVIHLAQRPGPATGLPTRTEQGDLNLVLYAGHGEFPRAIFAPGDIEEAFYLTQNAFNLADKYQVPVFVLTDQYLMDSYYNVAELKTEGLKVEHCFIKTDQDYKRYAPAKNGVSPRGIPGHGEGLICVDSDEHDPEGHITEDLEQRDSLVHKRLKKLDGLIAAALEPELIGGKEYKILVVGWGTTRQMICEALERMGRKDIAFLCFSQVYPLHPKTLQYLNKAQKVIMIENNAASQFAGLIKLQTGFEIKDKINKCNGLAFSVEEIIAGLESII